MPFENVTIRLPNGQSYGPTDFATLQEWARQGRVPAGSVITDVATGQQLAAETLPGLAGPVSARGPSDEVVSTIIPYRNPPALVGYYLGVFSLIACIPFLGIIGVGMAIAAFICGINGLRRAAQHPEAKGKVHAWIGIIGGGLCAVVGLLINVLVIVAIVAGK